MELNNKEMEKLNIIKKVLNKEITQVEAAKRLSISDRQVRRLINIYVKEREQGLIHKGRGKTNKNKISENVINNIIDKYIEEYLDYNFTHFYEELNPEISYSSIIRAFKKQDIISP